MKAMTLPVRPPSFPRVLVTPLAAPMMAGPAALVTRERPSEAFAVVFFAVSAAFCAALLVEVLSRRRVATRRRIGERSMGRVRDIDIVEAIVCRLRCVRVRERVRVSASVGRKLVNWRPGWGLAVD